MGYVVVGYIAALLFFFLGLIIGSFGIIQILVIVRFSIPLTKELKAHGVIRDGHLVINSNMKTIYIWVVITIVSIVLILNLASNFSFIGFISGILVSIFFGFSGTGYTESNYNEYYANYLDLIDVEKLNSPDD